MKLRIFFPGFECRLDHDHFGELLTCIRHWLTQDEGQYMWALASLDRIYLRITDTSANSVVPPDYPLAMLEIGYLYASAFEKEHVLPSDVESGVWSLSEADARKFLASVAANALHGAQEIYFEVRYGGIWKCGAMPSFSES